MKAALLFVLAALAAKPADAGEIVELPGLARPPSFKMFGGYVEVRGCVGCLVEGDRCCTEQRSGKPSLSVLTPTHQYSSPMLKSQHFTYHWIVESQNNPATDPIIFWSNGGPGCSGLFGMGFEHGPFTAQADGGLLLNPYSWNRNATVVYIEQPAGVGFSYSSNPSDYEGAYNDGVAASDNEAFIKEFFNLYPQYQTNPLFLVSESYGGNYVPQWAWAILTGTDERLKAQLKSGGIAVGNPVFSSDTATFENIMDLVTLDILYGHALIPRSFVTTYKAAGCDSLKPPADPCDSLQSQLRTLAGSCYGGFDFFGNECGDNLYSNPYGNATLGPATVAIPSVDALWGQWLNRPDVQLAIHANAPRQPWSDCSPVGYDVTWPSNLPDYTAIFAAGLRVLIFSGDLDVTTCPFASTQYAVDTLATLPGGQITTPWTYWTVASLPGQQAGGYLEIHGSFAFASVKGGGHEAPGFQPLASFELMNAFLQNRLTDLVPKASLKLKPAQPKKLTQGSILRSKYRTLKQDL